MLRSKVVIWLIALVFVGVAIGVVAGLAIQTARPPTFMGRIIPAEGLLQFPQSANPGDPENAVRDFKRIYKALVAYRDRYKKLPLPSQLTDTSKPLMDSVLLDPDDFENPDNAYRQFDLFSGQPLPEPYSLGYYPLHKHPWAPPWYRPSPIFNKPGERCLWATTSIYCRSNAKRFPDGSVTLHYSGCHVVLWSDGTVEKIPQSKMLVVVENPKKMWLIYPGDWNIPDEAIPITEVWKQDKLYKEGRLNWE